MFAVPLDEQHARADCRGATAGALPGILLEVSRRPGRRDLQWTGRADLYAYDADTGELRWTFPLDPWDGSSRLVAASGPVFLGVRTIVRAVADG
jgi:hypothetical protein